MPASAGVRYGPRCPTLCHHQRDPRVPIRTLKWKIVVIALGVVWGGSALLLGLQFVLARLITGVDGPLLADNEFCVGLTLSALGELVFMFLALDEICSPARRGVVDALEFAMLCILMLALVSLVVFSM